MVGKGKRSLLVLALSGLLLAIPASTAEPPSVDPVPGGECTEPGAPLQAAGIRHTGEQSIPSGGISDYWALGDLEAGQSITYLFAQSGFGADFFTVRFHLLSDDACETVAVDEQGTPQIVVPEDGAYVLEVRSPDAHGGSYHATLAIV